MCVVFFLHLLSCDDCKCSFCFSIFFLLLLHFCIIIYIDCPLFLKNQIGFVDWIFLKTGFHLQRFKGTSLVEMCFVPQVEEGRREQLETLIPGFCFTMTRWCYLKFMNLNVNDLVGSTIAWMYMSPWYDLRGGLGVKNQWSVYLQNTMLCRSWPSLFSMGQCLHAPHVGSFSALKEFFF